MQILQFEDLTSYFSKALKNCLWICIFDLDSRQVGIEVRTLSMVGGKRIMLDVPPVLDPKPCNFISILHTKYWTAIQRMVFLLPFGNDKVGTWK